MSTSADNVNQAANRLEQAEHSQNNVSTKRLYGEINELRKHDLGGKNLSQAEWAQVDAKLHHDGVLSHVDIVGLKNGDVAIRGISEPSKGPDGKDSLVTRIHGTTFTYDSQGHVQSLSKKGDTWTYSSKDGKYHESINGKDTHKTTADVVTVNGGKEVVTHADGSSTTSAKWGGVIDRNADGQITREQGGHEDKTFKWKGDTLASMTVQKPGEPAVTYSRASDGKYYSSSDDAHKKPLDITVEPPTNGSDGHRQNGVVEVTDKSGNTTDIHWGGERVHWDPSHKLTEIDYSNGNKATDFTYASEPLQASSENPLGLPALTGFKMTGKDGQTHSYSYSAADGTVSVDGRPGVKGTLASDASGNLTVTQTGDGSDDQYTLTKFGLGGSEVVSGKFGGQTLPEEIVNWAGKTSKFKYDTDGNLTSIDTPYGPSMVKKGNQWLDASGNPVNVTPTVEANGNFSVMSPEGLYITWNASGTRTEGIPDTPDAIAKEAKIVQEYELRQQQGSGDSGPKASADGRKGPFQVPNGAVEYDTSESDRTSQEMSVDTDGTGTGTGTSYFDGKISAQNVNYVALNPGWAAAHGIEPGAIVAARHNGRTEYAVYADNSAVDGSNKRVHTEGSAHLAEALAPGNGSNNSVPDVDFYALPNVHIDTSGYVSQAQIDRIGERYFGVVPA